MRHMYIGIIMRVNPYLELMSKLLFLGYYSEISNGRMPNVLGTDWLEVTGSQGSETYTCPNTQDYIDADTDNIWFYVDEMPRTVTTQELVCYDLQRIPVRYDDNNPNQIRAIGILKAGETVEYAVRDDMFEFFELPILWDDSYNDYGHEKDKDTIGAGLGLTWGQNLWVPETLVYPLVVQAEVNVVTPTQVLITCDTDLDEDLVPSTSAFTIATKTINSVGVSGRIITLTLSAPLTYSDTIIVNYTRPTLNPITAVTGRKLQSFTGQYVINLLRIGDPTKTVAWYDFTNESTITKIGSTVSAISDITGNGNTLSGTGTWAADGVTINGAGLYSSTVDVAQPYIAYFVHTLVSDGGGVKAWLEFIDNLGFITQYSGWGPNWYLSSPTSAYSNITPGSVGQKIILRAICNGTSSYLKKGAAVSTALNAGTGGTTGIRVGNIGWANRTAHLLCCELIIRNTLDDETDIYNYLKEKYSL